MTNEQTMLALPRPVRTAVSLALAALALVLQPGCSSDKRDVLVAPEGLSAPYDVSRGEVLWAIAPLRNESGTSLVDVLDVSDKVMGAVAQVRGVRAVPVNRTIAAMRALEMSELSSPADARRLAAELGADALIVGSITAWDAYRPTVGLALAVYARPGALNQRGGASLDVDRLRFQPTDYKYFARSAAEDAPASVVSEYLDGQNHQTLLDVRRYAAGRHDPHTALGWRRYVASMPLFTEFAAWQAVGRLIDHEWIRLARPRPTTDSRQ